MNEERLYSVEFNGADDYISDAGLDATRDFGAKLPEDFEIANCQVFPKTVQATIRFDHAKDVYDRAEDLPNLLNAAMAMRTMEANLRAAREEIRRLRSVL